MIKRRVKPCVVCGNNRVIYAIKMCRYCYKKDLSIRAAERKRAKDAPYMGKYSSEVDMFKQIWNKRKHVSFVSGESLIEDTKSPLWYSQFAHVLPKGKYRELKFKEENVVLLTVDEHFAYDNHTKQEASRLYPNARWDKIFRLKDELLEDYEKDTVGK